MCPSSPQNQQKPQSWACRLSRGKVCPPNIPAINSVPLALLELSYLILSSCGVGEQVGEEERGDEEGA